MKKKSKRGGPGRNQGIRPGTYKNAEKPPEERHSVKQQVTYTTGEFERVQDAMATRGTAIHTEFAREAVLKLTDEVLTGV